MTTPSTSSGAVAATSPVLGPDPDRPAGGYQEPVPADLAATLAEVSAEMVAAARPAAEAAVDGEVLARPTVAAYRDQEGRVHYASPYSKRTLVLVASGQWTEVDPDEPPFDPSDRLVREVLAYLEEHAGDEAEVARVKAAEAAGDDRPTIAAWAPDSQ